MANQENNEPGNEAPGQTPSIKELKKEISRLQAENRKVSKELKVAQYQALLSDTMIDIAEKELNIVIRKDLPEQQ